MTTDQPKVLIVDDHARNLNALEVMLKPLGCETVRAESADQALLCLLKHDFAAIVLDIRMPGMNGIDLAKPIKQRKRSQDVPLLFLTAHMVDESDALQGYGVGAVDYLSTPVNADVLRSKVAVFLDLFRHSRALAELNRTLEREVVERVRAEAALREQEQRLRIALEASAGGSWTWVAGSNQVDWDQRFRALYGFGPDEPATPDAWVTRVHEEDRPRLLALREEMWTSGTNDSWEITYRIVRRDGTVAWIQSRGRVDRDADGNVTRLTGLDLDFTRHYETEVALRALRDEEHDRALRTLLETATQGIVSVDADGVIVTANRALEAMFGWAVGELIGQPIEQLLPPSFRDAHVRHRTGYLAAPRARLMGGGLNLVGMRKDGSSFPIEVSLNHVRTPGGGRAFAFVTDITDRQRAASALERLDTTQLSRMASDLTLAEQHAREQIAKTLHDGLQQLLVIAVLNLEEQLRHDSKGGAAPSERLSEAKHHLDEAIAAARSLSFELFPPVLQRSGLPSALSWLADWTRDKYKIDVRFIADPRGDSVAARRPHAAVRVGPGASVQCGQTCAGGPHHAGADARPRRPAVHRGVR